MVDMFGNTVLPGDKIVLSKQIRIYSGRNGSLGRSPLMTGTIDKLMANGTIAVVMYNGRRLQLKSKNILKYDWPTAVDPD